MIFEDRPSLMVFKMLENQGSLQGNRDYKTFTQIISLIPLEIVPNGRRGMDYSNFHAARPILLRKRVGSTQRKNDFLFYINSSRLCKYNSILYQAKCAEQIDFNVDFNNNYANFRKLKIRFSAVNW